jgi:2-C-methyl-D-erythritol 4-phosphate cytidylyltransferase
MNRQNRVAAIIVAAGEGARMGTAEKKQYMMLGNRPVLAHSLSAFEQCDAIEKIFLVIANEDRQLCQKEVIDLLGPRKPVHLVSGGTERQESVYKGLLATDGQFDLVVIHDGVRPLVRSEHILESVRIAEKYGGCILAIQVTDSIKTVDEENRVVVTMKRDIIRMAQTPQTFAYNLILGAHVAARKENYVGTDDAELLEKCGKVVKVIPGDPHNIKITTPEDLKIAEALLQAHS